MAKNANLRRAKEVGNQEFYTRYEDIQDQVNAYISYNPDVFRNKTILLPCDDPEWSNFTRYFAEHFEDFGIKKLISTSYANDSKQYKSGTQITLWELESENYDESKTNSHGKIFTLVRDKNNSGRIDLDDLEFEYLEGDGDFRSEEVCKLRDEADFIITNPPFSMLKEFIDWIFAAKKSFLFIGRITIASDPTVFSLIKDNKLWLGKSFANGNAYFKAPVVNGDYADGVYDESTGLVKFRNCVWYTNIDFGLRHKPVPHSPMADHIKYGPHKDIYGSGSYLSYYNYDGIEVKYADAIPSDYDGIMGVGTSWLSEYCPEQFELVGLGSGVPKKYVHKTLSKEEIAYLDGDKIVWKTPYTVTERKLGNSLRISENGIPGKAPFARVLIRYTDEWKANHPDDFKKEG